MEYTPQTWHYILLSLVATLPSAAWLFYFLKKDCHPEPKSMIARTFLMAVILSPIAILLQLLIMKAGKFAGIELDFHSTTFILWAAFVEEVIKFYSARLIVFRSAEFDEPVDAMIYMITAALGFAAMENILLLSQNLPKGIGFVAGTWVLRFAGATLLHALSSAILGYFVALAWFYHAHKRRLMLAGIAFATIFHFAFNMFLNAEENRFAGLSAVSLLLVTMAFFVSYLFDRIKERNDTERSLLV